MVVLEVSISSFTEDWVDIFGLVWPAVAAGCSDEDDEDKDEVDEVLTAGVRHFDLDLALLLLRVLVTAAGEGVDVDCCCCWL